MRANERCSVFSEVGLGADERSAGEAIASFLLDRPSMDGIYVANPSGNSESLISFLDQMAELLR